MNLPIRTRRARRVTCGALLAATFSLVPWPAQATPVFFRADLGPEVAGATGDGSVRVMVDLETMTLSLSTAFEGLSGATTVAHIHCCTAVPGTGFVGVAVSPPSLPGFPVGVLEGTYSRLLDLSSPTTYSAAFLSAAGGTPTLAAERLLAGIEDERAYLNIHTRLFPAGEIRGFLVPVPEPSSMALLGAALAGLALRRRRA